MNITQPIATQTGMFAGRIGRLHYFIASFLIWLLPAVPYVAAIATLLAQPEEGGSLLVPLLLFVISGFATIFTFVIYIGLLVRRVHDFNAAGIWAILAFIPFVGPLFQLIVLFVPGDDAENSHGPSPAGTSFNLKRAWFGS